MFVSELITYPLKSGAAFSLAETQVSPYGLLYDRRAMLVRPDGSAVTARDCAAMMGIRCRFGGRHILVSALGQPTRAFDLATSFPMQKAVDLWNNPTIAATGNAEADAWFSQMLDMQVQLVVSAEATARAVEGHPTAKIAFADAVPVLIANESSLLELNRYLDDPTDMQRFRPNLVIRGAEPFAEDRWKRIRIGAVEFDLLGPCDRCSVVAIDPRNPSAALDRRPLSGLSAFRKDQRGTVYFGEMALPLGSGRLALDQEVEIISSKSAPKFAAPHRRPVEFIPAAELEPHLAEMSPARFEVECVENRHEAEGTRSIVFRRVDGFPISFRPGQFLMLSGHIDGVEWRRCYSLSSAPGAPPTISVKRVAGGTVSNWLQDHLKPGDRLLVSGPSGHFRLDTRPGRKLVLLSAGSGITPVMSMLRWLRETDLQVDVVFQHSTGRFTDMAFGAELAALADARFKLSFSVTQSCYIWPETLPNVREGRLDGPALAELIGDIDERVVFACGPAAFLQTVRKALGARPSFQMRNLVEERFSPPEMGQAIDVPQTPPQTVEFRQSGGTFTSDRHQTLLQIIRASGRLVESACEIGSCGTCRTRIISGDVELADFAADRTSSALSDQDKAKGYVLACCAIPKTALVIDL